MSIEILFIITIILLAAVIFFLLSRISKLQSRIFLYNEVELAYIELCNKCTKQSIHIADLERQVQKLTPINDIGTESLKEIFKSGVGNEIMDAMNSIREDAIANIKSMNK